MSQLEFALGVLLAAGNLLVAVLPGGDTYRQWHRLVNLKVAVIIAFYLVGVSVGEWFQ